MSHSDPGLAVAALAGMAARLGAAVVASHWMPFGEAATVEPSPGVDADWLVFGLCGFVTAVLGVAGAAAAAWLALAGSSSQQTCARLGRRPVGPPCGAARPPWW
jgi:hypothetical protein